MIETERIDKIWEEFSSIWIKNLPNVNNLSVSEREEIYRKLSYLWMSLPVKEREVQKAQIKKDYEYSYTIILLLEETYKISESIKKVKEISDRFEADQCGNAAQA